MIFLGTIILYVCRSRRHFGPILSIFRGLRLSKNKIFSILVILLQTVAGKATPTVAGKFAPTVSGKYTPTVSGK